MLLHVVALRAGRADPFVIEGDLVERKAGRGGEGMVVEKGGDVSPAVFPGMIEDDVGAGHAVQDEAAGTEGRFACLFVAGGFPVSGESRCREGVPGGERFVVG